VDAPELIPGKQGSTIAHLGPSLEQGPLPTLIYLALSGYDSLTLDPFNQPIVGLEAFPVRVISFDLPGHGPEMNHREAPAWLAHQLMQGNNPIAPFLATAYENILQLIDQGYIDPERIILMGVSRGGWLASLLSLMDERLRTVVAFAPITHLGLCQEFQELKIAEINEKYSLHHLAEGFVGKELRFYIGNRDERVNTDGCVRFIRKVADLSFDKGIRSAPAELILSASIGHLGHGTPPHIFKDGANWALNQWSPSWNIPS
jgi:pimeloyl-ACP methyl ester carboxylesterase